MAARIFSYCDATWELCARRGATFAALTKKNPPNGIQKTIPPPPPPSPPHKAEAEKSETTIGPSKRFFVWQKVQSITCKRYLCVIGIVKEG